MRIDVSNKRVLVTGGNSGLGASIAAQFAEAGASVAINYIANPEAANTQVASFRQRGGKSVAIEADVTLPAPVKAMFQKLDKAFGGIDVLINSAGIDGARAVGWESNSDQWSKVIDINLKGAYLCAREALKRMVTQRSGVIINISSVHERIAWAGYSAYTASKAGVSMMAKTLAQEAAPYGVRVLCIAPGAIRTPINEKVWDNKSGYHDLLTKIPLGRIGEPIDVAQLAVVLASDIASYVTGTTVFVDGGMTDYPSFSHGG